MTEQVSLLSLTSVSGANDFLSVLGQKSNHLEGQIIQRKGPDQESQGGDRSDSSRKVEIPDYYVKSADEMLASSSYFGETVQASG